uniref:hypothetical protein n=1 Tax=Flavobacterium sp. TaxID=239 RepID=UPI004049A2B4
MGTEDKLYNKIKHAAKNTEQKDFPGMDKIWARVEEKLETNVAKNETSNWKKIAIAASIVLVATIGYQFYTDTETIVTPQIVNEVKLEDLNSKEVIVETAKENEIINNEEADAVLVKQIQNTNNEIVITSVQEKKAAVYYPEEINIVNNDEVITYVRSNKKAEVTLAKEKLELLPFGKEQEEKLTQNGHYNSVSSNTPKYSVKGIRKDNFEADTSLGNESKTVQSKKLKPLIVIDGEASKNKDLYDLTEEQLDSVEYLDDPLYIINGVEYSEQELFGPNPTSPYAPLNKQKIIKTIILKDTEAVKEYGEKGKKGVVIITTKDGKPKK